jgi:hypothetical protein
MAVCMRLGLCGFMVLLLAWPAAAQSGGVPPEWEVRQDLAGLAERIQRFKPILDQVKPLNWQDAPAAYVDQGKRVSAEIDYLIASTQALAAQPEKLTAALTTYFRMQSLDLLLRSYADGIRKYQNPALAELLQGALSSSAADREKLRQYIVDLAAFKEQQFRVADQEAQQCRGVLPRHPQAARKEERK